NPDNWKSHLRVDPPWMNIWKASGVTVDGFTLYNGLIGIGGDVNFPPTNTTIRNCSIIGSAAGYGKRGVSISSYADNCTLDRLYMTDHFPDWICWEDVKIFYANYSLQNTAISNGGGTGFNMRGCYIRDFHDALNVAGGGLDWNIHHNVFEHIQDDGIQLASHAARINIHHNAFIDCGTSVSKNAIYDPTLLPLEIPIDNPDPGKKYIHHNLIDTRNLRYWYRRNATNTFDGGDSQGRKSIVAFSQHSFDRAGQYKDPRKIYNNTVLASNMIGAGRYGAGMENVQTTYKHEIFNNIFHVAVPTGLTAYMEHASDHSDPADHSTLYDGNSYYFIGTQTDVNSLFHPTMLLGTPDIADFADLCFHSDNTWETNGGWVDPMFVNRVPTNTAIDSIGVDISGKTDGSGNAWPGVIDSGYCGAFDRVYGDTITLIDPLVVNAGFENVLDDSGGWLLGLSGGTIAADTTEFNRGSASVKVERITAGLSYVESLDWQPVIPGRVYQARVFAKGSNVQTSSHGILMKFKILNRDGSIANGTQSVKKYDNFGWEELTANITIAPNVVGIKVRLCLYEIGTAWFDNVQLFQAPNLMPNPSFEEDVTSDYILRDFVQVSDEVYSGQYAIRCSSADPADFQNGLTVQERLPVTVGKKLKVMIYTKLNAVSGSASNPGVDIKTNFYDSSGTYISRHSSVVLAGTKDWTLLKTEGMVPNNAVHAAVVFRLTGQGTVWFDHLRVYEEE
ncbi:MAG: right-handed parallel beta-helix repeat-containing protein, partial [Victivallaceae bacterium]|nr:right-handed parallel beta-helix repeat-containing protein [Victivallaceae bacterium]